METNGNGNGRFPITLRHPIDEEFKRLQTLIGEEPQRGQLIEYDKMQAATGLHRDKYPWGKLVKRMKGWLLEKGLSVQSESGRPQRL